MTDFTNPTNDQPSDTSVLTPELNFSGLFELDNKIGVTGFALGFADGTQVNQLIVDVRGNSTSVTATIMAGPFEVSNIDVSGPKSVIYC